MIRRFGSRRLPFVLESSQSNDGLGEWSFFGAEPFDVVVGRALSELREVMRPWRMSNDTEIPFIGGAVGYLAYDYGRRIESIPNAALDDRGIPDMYFGIYDGVAAYHHKSGKLYLIAHGFKEPAKDIIKRLRGWIEGPFEAEVKPMSLGPWEWNLSKDEFARAVERVREYIASGDVYQVNLSRRARCAFTGQGLDLYAALREGNPAPYSAYLSSGEFEFISTSPEQFLQKKGSQLVTRPIKGTRPRSGDPEKDLISEEELRASRKDRAELLMIVDLERNDLGRVAEFGSVHVEGLFQLEHYRSVIHQTAQVKAKLAEGEDVYRALTALFPGGSITGAPKVRAMEIIEELEPTRRGAYCGSVGYIGFNEDAEFNIAIRSLHLKAGRLDYQVGGGIVWDSEAESEYQETVDKGRAICETLDRICQP
ncbi:aminodeoxychorismate synthase component I [Coraliomargarita sinensis]|uniref:aminodeoxychorismate synthase component I n=1 Tax=Coraliomargarita sinensis TaxID=2174842 RepID=UPI0013048967|nr:aminodeoxychorismate synthase component I [Coraliomargarita sinensis]